ncbi:MAG: beta-propeller domain-containing protein [Dehalococcoidia bacterium]
MKHEDLIEKLEHLQTPEIELPGHKQALKMALLNSGRFKERTIMNWAKILAPITAALLLIAALGVFVVNKPGPLLLGGNQISRFASYEELKEFIKTNTQNKAWGPIRFWSESGAGAALAPSTNDYSTTNIQVAGVDEADIVKTDGEYIYLVSGNKTIIVKAYPPEEAQVLSEIEVEGTVTGIFINGDRLVVFEEETPYYPYYDVQRGGVIPMPLIVSPKTYIKVYDISDRENPRLQRNLSADGQYVSSRMIGDYAYVVINEPVYEQDDELNLPKVYSGGNETEIPATDIYYSDVSDYYYMYTTIMAINTQNDDQEPTYETILLGASSNVYVSLNNIYLTFPVWGTGVGDFQKTSIYRIHIEGDKVESVATGEVPGMVLNQFSMDEYDGYFRVATTTYQEASRNNIYILDMDLNIVGSLIDLAQGETIHSARFMGERGYLVTFKKTDPLFVIDLSDPSTPQVLGELKMPGYSDYLHPYDQNHLIGIGKEAVEAEEGDFAWYQGIKIALFDVSDVNNPVEISTYVIGDRGTDSPVLYDHKAFLFDKTKNLLVIPVLVAEIDESEYPEGVPSNAYGKPVWQGAYVFNISLDQGLQLKGKITHIENLGDLEQDYYFYSPFSVTRSLYIGDVLYTISDAKIKMNSLGNLDYINEVQLPSSTWTPPNYLPNEPGSEKPSPDAQPGGEKLS